MFAKTIIDSDAFLDMPLSTQALYFHLSMRADDDGFINNPRKIQRVIGASEDDLKLLVAKNFIIPFESGVVVIKHWRIHNYIQKDRYTETVYQDEKAMLKMKDNKSYTMDTPCIQNVSMMETQVSKDKISLVEDRKEKEKKPPAEPSVATVVADSGLSEEVKEALREFSKMRTKIKAGMTPNAMKLLIGNLLKLSEDPAMQVAILNQSIEKSWKGVYPLKDDAAKTAPKQEPKKPTGTFYRMDEHPHDARTDSDVEKALVRRRPSWAKD